ncbi:hypothetical protein Taro_046652 [Colocasia esculenta]|uniref:Transmembrane protein n=1 Tax=Colocasia esculenta TaxID=4460 RepID=A0A843WSZ9_COLES|nr:hypothetical protein [Colocasia esculenta]
MASRPRGVPGVRGGSACGPSTLWRSEVVVLVWDVVLTWLLCGLDGCVEGCFRLVPDSVGFCGCRELSVGRVAEAAVAPCVVSSSESKCCELLYLMHISLDYSSNPSRSSDPWVATRISGSLAGVREVGCAASLQGSCACCRRVAAVAMSRAWRVWSLSVFVSWWHGWRWTRWQWSSRVEDGCGQVQRRAVIVAGWTVHVTVCLGVSSQGVVPLAVRLAVVLASLSCCSFPSFSIVLVGLCVSPWLGWFVLFSCARRAFPEGGLVSVVGVWLAVLLVEVSVLRCGFPSLAWKRLVALRLSFLCFGGLLSVAMLHCGVVLPGCASLRPSGGVIFP